MAITKTPDGGFYIDDRQFDIDYQKHTITIKGNAAGGGGMVADGAFDENGNATCNVNMDDYSLTNASKLATNGSNPVFIGSVVEKKGTQGIRICCTSDGDVAVIKPDTQDTYVHMYVADPTVSSHAANRKYVDGIETAIENQLPTKIDTYLKTPDGQALIQANSKPGKDGAPGRDGLDGASIHVTTQQLVAQGSGNLNNLTGDNIKAGDVVLDADGVIYHIQSVTDSQYTVGDEITKLIKSPVTETLPLVAGASVVYGGKFYMTSDGIVDVTFEIALDSADLTVSKRVIATLPNQYRPAHTVAAPATIQLKDGNREAASVYCGTDGQITLSTNADLTQILRITSAFAFVVK